ncbi:glycosyltransferase family 4 protein [Magnetospirillum sp. UT-4]|uniref:MraY family glycosyltransferase n=1 Tax=Magnetospirillum sp. UT-4 TaxID=2681467 RepID=UPI00137C9D79|nr:glycosyltransferase family 4 protein [Magnetospirillum sp. UT-4]CAA7621660.1 Glycosyl transferase, family 4 [Magnetospirillum sp. UT-4]
MIDGAVAHGLPLAVAAGALTVLATRRVLAWLHARQILDHPNERSSHALPTPRGGGLATTPVMAALVLAAGWGTPLMVLGLGALALLGISWWDDRVGLAPLPRLLSHAVAVAVGLALLPGDALVLGGAVPVWADRLLAGLAWLWFVNLYNFMDGIDGITGVETVSLGLGIALVAGSPLAPPSLVVAAVGGAFLLFNWHPAKLFLGDSGSVPFGYVLGGLLLQLALSGHLAAALILPAYYVADATITISRRALAGEKVWQAHRKHFYQRAVQGGKRHDQVAGLVASGNALLIACALLASSGRTWEGVAGALLVTAAMLAVMQVWSRRRPA